MMAMELIQDMFVCTPGIEVFTFSVEMISMGRLLVKSLDGQCHYRMMVIYWPLEHTIMMAMVLIQDMFVCTPGIEVSQCGNDIDGEAAGDYSGFSLSLSNDGTNWPLEQEIMMAMVLIPCLCVFF
jgi:hypothetical protein